VHSSSARLHGVISQKTEVFKFYAYQLNMERRHRQASFRCFQNGFILTSFSYLEILIIEHSMLIAKYGNETMKWRCNWKIYVKHKII
jgi:hypothetical protein